MDVVLLVPAFQVVNFIFVVEVQQIKSIEEQVLFQNVVEGSVSCKAGAVVYFQKDGGEVLFNQNVESKYFETN